MLKNYFKTALRNLIKNKLYTVINIVGLGVAVACSIVAYVNYQFSQSFDSFHENADKIYRVNSYKIVSGEQENWAITPMALTPAFKKDVAGVEAFTRFQRGNGTIRFGDKVFNESFHFVDEDYFEMFTYPIIYGSREMLSSENGVVINKEVSIKFFGDVNPVGEQVVVTIDGNKYSFMINGVIENSPTNSSLPIEIAFPMKKYKDIYEYDIDAWENWSRTSFIQIAENISPAEITAQLDSYKDVTLQANSTWQIEGFYIEPLLQIAFSSRDIYGNILRQGLHPAAIIGPSATAILILLLACFNFVNTAIGFSGRRLNEIAIRKVVGSKRIHIVYQFLGENLILCFIALLIGIMLAEIFVPAYNSLWPHMELAVNYFENFDFLFFLISILLFTAIAAGAYPAIYVSGFKSVNILRNKQKLRGSNLLIRLLLVFQFSLSITTIICGIIFNLNADFVSNYDMGFHKENVVIVPLDDFSEYELLKGKIENDPRIIDVSASRYLVGFGYSLTEAIVDEEDTQLNYLEFGENYVETMGLEIIEGRSFNKELATDYDESVLVNQTFIDKYGWNSIRDKTLKIRDENIDKEYRVIGLVKDFSINGVWRKIEPLVIVFAKPERNNYLIARFTGNDPKVVFEDIQAQWKQTFPDRPFGGFYQAEINEEAVKVSNSIGTIFLYISLIAILISAMGLFALISLNVAKRTKEIGIRKVLGATVLSIGRLISKEYVVLYIIASLLAVGSGYYMVNIFISSIYAYYVQFGAVPFILSILIVLFIGLITVSSQVYGVATLNPADAIRDE
ncbi:ABC transporter permease [Bacteroidota bacterium]